MLGSRFVFLSTQVEVFLQIFETYHHNCQIIKRLLNGTLLYNAVRHLACDLVNRYALVAWLLSLSKGVPAHVQHMLIRHSVKNTIAPQNHKVVKVRAHSELTYLRLRNNNSILSAILCPLTFNVSKGTGNTEPAWHNAMGPQHNLLLYGVLTWHLNILYGLRLINLAPISNDSSCFVWFIRPMVSRE